MEAGTALRLHFTLNTHILNRISKPKSSFTLPSSSPSNSSTVYSFRSPKPKRDFLADWVSQNDDVVRPLPIYVGTASLFAVLFNRAISGIAPVADAGRSSISLSSDQSKIVSLMFEIEVVMSDFVCLVLWKLILNDSG
jgi:hypothetical protein